MTRTMSWTLAGMLTIALSPFASAGIPVPVPTGGVHDAIDNAQELAQENLLWNALNATHDRICGPDGNGFQTMQCNQTTGHYGYGQLRFGCKTPRTQLARPLWDAVYTADGATDTLLDQQPLPPGAAEVRICAGAWDALNATAAAYGPEFR